jgi:hypothetical protein
MNDSLSIPSTRTNRIGSPLLQNTWHTLTSSDTVLVYVHGFFSDSDRCWTSKSGPKWPDLVVNDDRFNSPSIFMAGYYTDLDSGEYKISDCAREVFDSLSRPGIEGEPTVLSKKNIVFVCHSLGGIVTRYMIERNRESFLSKCIGLFLIASPSYGAEIASSFSGLIKLFNNKTARQLTLANESLDDLDDRFKDLLANRTIPVFYGAEAIEHHFPFHWKYLPALKPIVSKASAGRYFGASKLLSGTDHSTCVKPTSHRHVSHEFLISNFLEFNKFITTSFSSTEKKIIHSEKLRSKKMVGAGALFEVYVPEYEEYYIARNVDIEIAKFLEVYCLWVHGASGLGKTAAVRRWVQMQDVYIIQVYIGETGDTKDGHIALLREIYFTVAGKAECGYKEFTTTNQIINEIVRLLISLSAEQSVCLLIDEIPLIYESDEEMLKFVQAVHSIAVQLKQRLGSESARIIATSIFNPVKFLADGSERIFEHIRFFNLHNWDVRDLERLIKVITAAIPTLNLSQSECISIANSGICTPRFVKTVFKNLCARGHISQNTVAEIIRETKIQLGYFETGVLK